jgi:cell division protein FtsZ
MIDIDYTINQGARISVIGIGGGGGNAVNNMIAKGIEGVHFIVANTDKQALDQNLAPIKVQIGKNRTRGLGAGANPETGKESVEENLDDLKELLKGTDMLFVTCGMGGGTGTGGAPVIARIGKELGALVVAIVTKPFRWEGLKRNNVANNGISQLREYVDALIVIPNQKLRDVTDRETKVNEAFLKANEVLFNATKGIAEIITCPGLINVDFADVRTIMQGMGDALIGIGTGSGKNRAAEATQNALNSPLLEDTSVAGSQGVLVNITGGSDLTMHEVDEIGEMLVNSCGEDANLIYGVVNKDDPMEEVSITVIATGFAKNEEKNKVSEIKQVNVREGQLPFPHNTVPEKKYQAPIPMPIIRRPVMETGDTVMSDKNHFGSPKGSNQLKRYETPAFERRLSGDNAANITNEMGKMDMGNDNFKRNALDTHEIGDYNGGQPAFLRKIMS